MVAWACATLVFLSSSAVFQPIVAEASRKLAEFKPQEFSSLIWACAAGRVDCSNLVHAFASNDLSKVKQFKPQELSMTLWSLAKSHCTSLELSEAVARIAAAKLQAFSPKNLSNLFWAFATLLHSQDSRSLFAAAASTTMLKLSEFKSQELANCAWAFATHSPDFLDFVKAVSTAAVSRMQDFKAQGLSNLAWSCSKVRASDADFCGAIAREVHMKICVNNNKSNNNNFEPQHLSNLAWAFASCAINDEPLMDSLAREAMKKLPGFAPQGLSGLAWSCATLVRRDIQLLRALAAEAPASVRSFKMQELSNTSWAFATLSFCGQLNLFASFSKEIISRLDHFHVSSASRDTMISMAKQTLAAVWAFNFGGHLEPLFAKRAHELLLRIGRGLDEGKAVEVAYSVLALCNDRATYPEGLPQVALQLQDRLVIWKPPGWEVERTGEVDGSQPAQLLGYLQGLQGHRNQPLAFDAEHHYGFMHRLDVPSSGLVFTARTYEAYYDLAYQLTTGRLVRDYVVLCHGAIPQSCLKIDARIRWSKDSPLPSSVSPLGKPSITHMKVLAHASKGPDSFSLVAIRIETGRRHQIRVHAAHIGHPVVCDGKYTQPQQFLRDRTWCPRNFLHRYRLAFADREGVAREVVWPLPLDMKAVIAQLSPHNALSKEALSRWEGDSRPRDWQDY
ncbi:unnamed protein product, partial [Polarella glacialis]